MATPATVNPFNFYPGRDGLPLQNGYLYFGEPFQDPELQPLQAYWDDANTQPAARPIRTINGYPARNGAPAQVFVGAQYSMRVRDSQGREVFYAPNVTAVDLGGGGLDIITASGGQTVVTLTNAVYTPGSNAIDIALNGIIQISGQDYFETGTDRITMASALSAGDQIRAFARSTFGLTQAVLSDWQAEVFNGAGGGSQNFVLTRNPGAVANLDVSVTTGGVGSTLRPLIDYTLSGNTVTITPAPSVGTNNVLIRYGRSLPQDALRGELASTASASDGAAMVAFKQSDTAAAVRELMSRGRDTVSVFDFMTNAQIASVRAGDLVEDVTTACQACFTACKAQRTPWFPAGIYKTSAALVAYGGWHGAGAGTIFMPQGNHACFHFLPGTLNESWASSSIQAAFVGGFTIKFPGDSNTAGNVAHKGIWINKGIASASDGSCDNVTFGNIYFINPYNAFYQEFADKGNLWNVAFRDIMIIRPKDYGIFLNMTGSNGSLNVDFDNVCVDYNLATSYGKGALIWGIANLTFKGILTSRLTSDGAILSLSGCTNVVVTMQQENNNMSASGQRPTMIVDCKSVEMALVVNTSTVNPGVGNIVNYIYVEDQTNTFILRQFQVVGETIISGSRKVINAQLGAGSNTKFTILDGTVTSSDVVMSAAQLAATFFPATNYALQNNPATLRRHVARVDTTAGVATSLFSMGAYGGRIGKPAGLYVVYGTQNSDAAIGFTDLILVTGILGAQSVVVVSTNNIGAANARTYSISSDTLRVSIPTNIYRVSLAGFDGAGTWDTA